MNYDIQGQRLYSDTHSSTLFKKRSHYNTSNDYKL